MKYFLMMIFILSITSIGSAEEFKCPPGHPAWDCLFLKKESTKNEENSPLKCPPHLPKGLCDISSYPPETTQEEINDDITMKRAHIREEIKSLEILDSAHSSVCSDWEKKNCYNVSHRSSPDYCYWVYGWHNNVWTRQKECDHDAYVTESCNNIKKLPKVCYFDNNGWVKTKLNIHKNGRNANTLQCDAVIDNKPMQWDCSYDW